MADNIKFTPEDLNNAKEFNSAFRDINEEVNELFSGLNSITGEINNQTQGYKLASSAVRKLTGIIGKVKDIQDGITAANSKDLLILKSKAEAERKNLEESQRLLKEKLKLEGLSEKDLVVTNKAYSEIFN